MTTEPKLVSKNGVLNVEFESSAFWPVADLGRCRHQDREKAIKLVNETLFNNSEEKTIPSSNKITGDTPYRTVRVASEIVGGKVTLMARFSCLEDTLPLSGIEVQHPPGCNSYVS